MRNLLKWLWIGSALVAAGCGGEGDVGTEAPFVSEAGNFRVRMPGRPKVSEVGPGGSGQAIEQAVVETADKVTFAVAYADYPGGAAGTSDPDLLIDAAVRGILGAGGFRVVEQGPARLGPHPGREVRFASPAGEAGGENAGRARLFLVGSRLYQVLVVGPKGKFRPEDASAYLDSFELIRDVPAPAPAPPGPTSPALLAGTGAVEQAGRKVRETLARAQPERAGGPAGGYEPGLVAEFFAGERFEGRLAWRIDGSIDFDWDTAPPEPAVPEDFFLARWTGYLRAPAPGRYALRIKSDNGVRLTLGDALVFDKLSPHGIYNLEAEVELTGHEQPFQLDYQEGVIWANCHLSWRPPGQNQFEPIPPECFAHTPDQAPDHQPAPPDPAVPAVEGP